MAPQVTPEDDLKLLYYVLKLSGGTKVKYADLAKLMGLKENATKARYYGLLKRSEEEYGQVDQNGIVPAGNTTSATSTPKRKRAKKGESKSSKKVKTEDDDAEVEAEEALDDED